MSRTTSLKNANMTILGISEEHKISPELPPFLASCWNRIWEALFIRLIFFHLAENQMKL